MRLKWDTGQMRKQGRNKSNIKFSKIIINGERYTWEKEKEELAKSVPAMKQGLNPKP